MKPHLKQLLELAVVFSRLSITSFGGPLSHISMMEDELVRRRKWLTHAEFLDLLGATNLIPGPNSTELAIHIGQKRAGWPGLFTAGCAFIAPAAILVCICAWIYTEFGALPEVSAIMYGIKPVIIAIVAQALWGLRKAAIKNVWLALVACVSVFLNVVGINELLILLVMGLAVAVGGAVRWQRTLDGGTALLGSSLMATFVSQQPMVGMALISSPSLGGIFLFFAKVGSVLFGSGYVLLSFLRADLVEKLGWLTESQLLDAVTIGQLTPGPVFTTATFIGYLLADLPGAAVATIGIFTPAFIFVALSRRLVPWLRRSAWAGAFLDGVNVASFALMAVVTGRLLNDGLVDTLTIGVAGLSAVLLIGFKVNSAWLMMLGALVGLMSL